MAEYLSYLLAYLRRPIEILRGYKREDLRSDLIAGITVAVILLPQAIAFALIAELPPQMGLYAAIMGTMAGALWGSSNHIQTGPVNAISLLVASTLLTITDAGTAEYMIAASMMAFMAGLFQMALGMARLGVLVNFVSHSVIVGFATGAGILIGIKQLRPFFGLSFPSGDVMETLSRVVTNLPKTHLPTAGLGLGAILIIVLLRRLNPKLPGALISMVIASVVVFALGLDEAGVDVIGQLPTSLPPLANLPLFDLDLISQLSTGALAVGAIGLVQSAAIGRSIATQTGQQLDSNQEFVGQGMANIMAGLFSGYSVSASFTRSAVNVSTGARTPLAAFFSSLFVLISLFLLAPMAAFLPLSALAGVLILTAIGLVDYKRLMRIWRGARQDGIIMLVTLLGTLFLRLDFAVLTGILLSFAIYIANTSMPSVRSVVPDEDFRHFVHQPEVSQCPQLGILEIQGDLYFGAVHHVENAIQQHIKSYPTQRYLLLRMHNVNHCDFSGIRLLEAIVKSYRERAGDVYMVRVRSEVLALMKTTDFYNDLGEDNFLSEDNAIEHLFYRVLDPVICIYESNVRVFRECQKLARPEITIEIPVSDIGVMPVTEIEEILPQQLWEQLHQSEAPLVIDVREPREYRRGHIRQAELMPLPKLLAAPDELPRDQMIVFVCQSGRRSKRAVQFLADKDYQNVALLAGGMIEWDARKLLKAIEM